MTMRMAALPAGDRPRERLMARGVEALAERELLALVLRNGTRGSSALDLADELLAEYGSLRHLAACRPEELAARRGIGAAGAAALVAAFHLARRAESVRVEPIVLRGPAEVAAAAHPELATARRERVLVLVCDAANRLRRTVVVSEGAIDRSLVPVREILNAVLRHDGRAFALAHNHPSGVPEPSDADRHATTEVTAAAPGRNPGAPGGITRTVRTQPLRAAHREHHAVRVRVGTESVLQPFEQVIRIDQLVPQAQVDVLRNPRTIDQAHLQRHPALDHPPARLRPPEASHDPLEQQPAAKPGEIGARIPRTGQEPLLQCRTQRPRRAVPHDASIRCSARSM
jgi:DNA repair protein RadC